MIEVFADVVCPFTHVGLRRLVEHRARVGRADVHLLLRAWPLELVNDGPVDPAHIADEVAVLRAGPAPDLFAGFDVQSFPTTSLPALALTSEANAVSPTLGEVVGLELRALLFEQGVDVADPQVLADVATRHGLPADASERTDAVRAEHAAGQARGVQGSPHFFAGDTEAFCPSLEISRPDGELHVAFDPAAFAAFADAALAP